jgi:hypothetical protein
MADAQPVFEKIVECCERIFPAQAFALAIVDDGERVSLPSIGSPRRRAPSSVRARPR